MSPARHLVGALPPALYADCRAILATAAWREEPATGPSFAFDTCDLSLPPLDRWIREALGPQLGLGPPYTLQWKRLRPGIGRFPWHRDHRRGGDVGLVLNLSAGPVQGGVFEQRLRWEQTPAAVIHSQPRDVHTFDVANPRWVHRVTPVVGETDRVVYAGWAATP